TCFGWMLHGCCDANPRSLRNFQMQAHGAEMLRLACCLATERGIQVCAPVHDALLIEAPIDEIETAVATTREVMAEASRIVLSGSRCGPTQRSSAIPNASPMRAAPACGTTPLDQLRRRRRRRPAGKWQPKLSTALVSERKWHERRDQQPLRSGSASARHQRDLGRGAREDQEAAGGFRQAAHDVVRALERR